MDREGNLKIDEGIIAGNSTFRDSATLPAGQTEITLTKNWAQKPTTVNITPSFETTVWVENLSENGFKIKVSQPSTKDEKIYWVAVW